MCMLRTFLSPCQRVAKLTLSFMLYRYSIAIWKANVKGGVDGQTEGAWVTTWSSGLDARWCRGWGWITIALTYWRQLTDYDCSLQIKIMVLRITVQRARVKSAAIRWTEPRVFKVRWFIPVTDLEFFLLTLHRYHSTAEAINSSSNHSYA